MALTISESQSGLSQIACLAQRTAQNQKLFNSIHALEKISLSEGRVSGEALFVLSVQTLDW